MLQMKILTFISILSLSILSVHADHHEGAADGFAPIFDGKSLNNWNGDPKFWSVQDGAITGQTTAKNPTRGNTFIIWEAGEIDDFELKLKFKIEGGNSGIQIRSFKLNGKADEWRIGGYQSDFEAGDIGQEPFTEKRSEAFSQKEGKELLWVRTGKRLKTIRSEIPKN